MKTASQRFNHAPGTALIAACVAGVIGLPLLMTGCDKTESKATSTKTTTSETPEKTVKTTETTEKKVETNPK